MAVRRIDRHRIDAHRDQCVDALFDIGTTPIAAAQRRASLPSREAFGKSNRFWMSFTVIRPARQPDAIDERQLLDAMCLQQHFASSSESDGGGD